MYQCVYASYAYDSWSTHKVFMLGPHTCSNCGDYPPPNQSPRANLWLVPYSIYLHTSVLVHVPCVVYTPPVLLTVCLWIRLCVHSQDYTFIGCSLFPPSCSMHIQTVEIGIRTRIFVQLCESSVVSLSSICANMHQQ